MKKLRLPKSRARRVLLAAAVAAPALFLGGCVLVPRIASHVMTHPFRRENTVDPSERGLPFEAITIPAADGLRLAGWWVPPDGEQRATVIYFHGINDRRYKGLRYAPGLREAGIGMLLLDLRAHGESGGELCTYGWRERYDVVAAVEYVEARQRGKPIGLIGESLGGAVVIQGAALLGDRVDALCSVSTFADLPTTVGNYARRILGPIATDGMIAETQERAGEIADFPPDRIRPVSAASAVTAATLIVHGTDDGWIPIWNGEAIYNACGAEQKDFLPVEGAGHADIHRVASGEVWRARVCDWFAEHLDGERPAAEPTPAIGPAPEPAVSAGSAQ